MIDQYGCDENDFICKIKAKQAVSKLPIPTSIITDDNYNPEPKFVPQTQEQKDLMLANTVMQNQQYRDSVTGRLPEAGVNALGSLFLRPLMGTGARAAGNLSQGINPFDTTKTMDGLFGTDLFRYQGDTNSQGNPTGPPGSFERGLQDTYGNQYEKDIASMFGDGSPEHFAAISEQMGNTPTVQAQDGWFDGLLNSIGIGTSSAMPNFDNIVTGDGDNSGGNSGFHDSSHNWN